jgi:hypothetical protein
MLPLAVSIDALAPSNTPVKLTLALTLPLRLLLLEPLSGDGEGDSGPCLPRLLPPLEAVLRPLPLPPTPPVPPPWLMVRTGLPPPPPLRSLPLPLSPLILRARGR